MYSIGTILPDTEGRNVEYKAGGGNYPVTVLPSVVTVSTSYTLYSTKHVYKCKMNGDVGMGCIVRKIMETRKPP